MNTSLTLPMIAVLILLAGVVLGFVGAAVGEVSRRLVSRRFARRGPWVVVVVAITATFVLYQSGMRPWSEPWPLWTAFLIALALPSFIANVLDAKPEIRVLMIPAGGVFAVALFALQVLIAGQGF